jgi:hypothetical protein
MSLRKTGFTCELLSFRRRRPVVCQLRAVYGFAPDIPHSARWGVTPRDFLVRIGPMAKCMRLIAVGIALWIPATTFAQTSDASRLAKGMTNERRPISLALSRQRAELPYSMRVQRRLPTKHSTTFPIKLGAAIGCGAGAVAGYLISPYIGDPGPDTGRGGAMLKSCVVFGLVGAGIGYFIATH